MLTIAPVPTEKPLPERIRPLEGAGMINIASDMREPLYGAPIEPMAERARWRIAGPVCALLIAAGLLFLVFS